VVTLHAFLALAAGFLTMALLVAVLTALLVRLTRAGTREALLQDYVKFARAKGLGPGRVIGVHVLKNILIPIVTVIGLELGSVIAFAIVTESIFAWPGSGKLLIDSINQLDRPVIVAYLMVTVTIFIAINFAVDVLYSLLDPRVRYTGISFVYQFSGIFASGITPIVATALLAQGGGQPWLICAYVLFAGVVSAICSLLIRPVQAQKLSV